MMRKKVFGLALFLGLVFFPMILGTSGYIGRGTSVQIDPAIIFSEGTLSASHLPLWSYNLGDYPRSVAISNGGHYIVVCTSVIYLFDNNRTLLWSYDVGEPINSVDISGDGMYIVAGADDNRVYLFNRTSGTPMWSSLRSNDIRAVAISEDGNYIVAGSENDNVYLYNRTGATPSTPVWSDVLGGDVISVAISSDGEYIVASADNPGGDKIYMYDKDSSTELWSHNPPLYTYLVSISGDGMYVFGARYDGDTSYLYNRTDGYMWDYNVGGTYTYSCISNDSNYIALGGYSNTYFFDRTSSTPSWNYGGETRGVSLSANGSVLAACFNGKFCLFNTSLGTPIWSYNVSGIISRAAISSDGDYIAVTDMGTQLYLFHRVLEGEALPPDLSGLALLGLGGQQDISGIVIIIAVVGVAAGIVIIVALVRRK